jgi:hypothetical protein
MIDEVRGEIREETVRFVSPIISLLSFQIFQQSHKNQVQRKRKVSSFYNWEIIIKDKTSINHVFLQEPSNNNGNDDATGSSQSSSPAGSSEVPPLSSAKRAKKYSLAALSHEEVSLRKKEQNRIAAQRYRSRKNQTLEEGREEISYLEKRNADLRVEIYAIEQEITQLKETLVNGNCTTLESLEAAVNLDDFNLEEFALSP